MRRCGAPARALLYFEDHLRAAKNVINQASLNPFYPEGGGLDDASAAFLAATLLAATAPAPDPNCEEEQCEA